MTIEWWMIDAYMLCEWNLFLALHPGCQSTFHLFMHVQTYTCTNSWQVLCFHCEVLSAWRGGVCVKAGLLSWRLVAVLSRLKPNKFWNFEKIPQWTNCYLVDFPSFHIFVTNMPAIPMPQIRKIGRAQPYNHNLSLSLVKRPIKIIVW